jgi:hypothetical protein
MADDPKPYVPHNPGDLITAEDWNDMQVDVRKDMAAQIKDAITKKQDVDHATNSDKIGGQSVSDLTKYILDQVFALLPKRTGYMQFFCNLKINKDTVIEHNLKTYPLADLYQLTHFPAVCASSERAEDTVAEYVLFYLYYAEEKRLRVSGSSTPIEIETEPRFRIVWQTLLDQLVEEGRLQYTDAMTIDELETNFWQAMQKKPNDEFDPDTYCHSPWFEKCCGQKRTVGDLRKQGYFEDIYLKVMPEKTINFPPISDVNNPDRAAMPAPSNVRVSHRDFDTVVLRLLSKPFYPDALKQAPISGPAGGAAPNARSLPEDFRNFLPVMLLLKV